MGLGFCVLHGYPKPEALKPKPAHLRTYMHTCMHVYVGMCTSMYTYMRMYLCIMYVFGAKGFMR